MKRTTAASFLPRCVPAPTRTSPGPLATRTTVFLNGARAALVAVAALVVVSCSGDAAPPPPSQSPTSETSVAAASATPEGSATRDTTLVAIQPLRAGDPVPFPEAVALYALDGTWEGPSQALRRYYRDAAGVLRTDDLLVSTYAATGEETRGVVGAVGGAVAGELAAGLCHGSCYGALQPVTVVLSEDGGISWQEVGSLAKGGWGSVVATTGGRALVREFDPGHGGPLKTLPAAPAPPIWSFPPDVAPNAAITTATIAGKLTTVALGTDQRTLWNLDGSGTPLVRIPLPPGERVDAIALIPHGGTTELHVQWAGGSEAFLAVLNVADGTFRSVYRYTQGDGLSGVRVTEWLTDTVALGRASFAVEKYVPSGPPSSGVPAIIDFGAGTVSPIAEFVRFLAAKAGGPSPVLVGRGPFVRVVGTGDCLNVREGPSAATPALGCFRDGVLLTERNGAAPAGWRAVATPDGRAGFAAADYLE